MKRSSIAAADGPVHMTGANFQDRADAGRQLAQALAHLKGTNPIVLALPRGGVPVAFEVANALDAPLDVVLVRKIGAPHQPELGLGAVVDGNDPQLVLNDDVVEAVQPGALPSSRKATPARRDRAPPRVIPAGARASSVKGRTVIVVDDGIATGGTMKAVLKALSRAHAAKLVLAVPVAPAESLAELAPCADEVMCLATPEPFYAVGVHYQNFEQTSDEEVIDLLARAAKRPS